MGIKPLPIITHKSPRSVRVALKALPADLSAKSNHTLLNQIFNARFARQFFVDLHKSFMAKSTGGPDEFGDRWKPLAPSTIARKQKKRKSRDPRKTDPFSSSQRRVWRAAYNRAFHKMAGIPIKDRVELAREQAWHKLKHSNSGLPKVPIGIDTERLEKSLRPGRLSFGTYYTAPKEQIATVKQATLRLGTDVPYSGYFHQKRRIYPAARKLRKWVQRASVQGILGVEQYLRRKLS